MPRLPTAEALGERPAPQPGTGAVGYRATTGAEGIEGQALANVGNQLQAVGDAISRIEEIKTKARRASQLSDAIGRYTGELGEAELTFQRDQDFKTSPQRFSEKSEEIRKRYESGIDDELVRATFTREARKLAQAKRLNVVTHAFGQEKDYNVSQLDTAENIFATQAANAVNVAERLLVENQFRLTLEQMRGVGWITDVDAGNRERRFLGKIDLAGVTRDMASRPGEVADRLATDAAYVPNLDPVLRERLIDQGIRRSVEQVRQSELAAERAQRARADEVAKDLFAKLTDKTLTREELDRNRAILPREEYQSLLKGLTGTDDRKDDPQTFSTIEGLMVTNPSEGRRLAFQAHRTGLIKNETLRTIVERVRNISEFERTVGRQEGPRSPYEREATYITNALKPSDATQDPAASARHAIAMRELQDYAAAGKRTEGELRAKADDIVKRVSMVNMVDLARRTGIAERSDPRRVIEETNAKVLRVMNDTKMRQETKNKLLGDYNETIKAAEAALAAGVK